LAEETGLIIPVGEWVLLTACRQVRAWQEAGFPLFTVAVNFSSEQFRHGNLLRTIPRVLQEAGLETSYLEMELTESSIMVDAVETINLLREFKKMGLNLSVDDFGTGYSSLNYLKRFPLDTLKIDRSFVMDIHKQSDDSAITHAIIAMAHGLQLNVIAEGVETKEQMEFLKKHGCDEIQGYWVCKPMPVDRITRYLEEYKKDRSLHVHVEKQKRKRLEKKSA
jgi:EAL domain-containing protein (putative c-di-GMP-specific phosphodiesterase class I)